MMKKNERIAIVGSLVVAAAIGVGFGVGVNAFREKHFTPEVGMAFLKAHGYQNVSGGERDFVGRCGRAFARSYQVLHDDQAKSMTVCFGIFQGPYLPVVPGPKS